MSSFEAMEEQRDHKRSLYHLHIELDKEYEPIRKRGFTSNVSNLDMQVLRHQGKKHIDILSDGRLYLVDPVTKSTPPFSSCSLH